MVWHCLSHQNEERPGQRTDAHDFAQSGNLVNVLDDFMVPAIAGLVSYKCSLVHRDICGLRMQDYQFPVVVFKSCS
jgi:hypothetical protein